MTPVIEVHELVKEYPGVRAVDGVSFSIPPGQCFGLLGRLVDLDVEHHLAARRDRHRRVARGKVGHEVEL